MQTLLRDPSSILALLGYRTCRKNCPIYRCIYKYVHIYIYIFIFTHVHMCNMYVWMYVCMNVWMYKCMNEWMNVWMNVCMNVRTYVCMHACMYVTRKNIINYVYYHPEIDRVWDVLQDIPILGGYLLTFAYSVYSYTYVYMHVYIYIYYVYIHTCINNIYTISWNISHMRM